VEYVGKIGHFQVMGYLLRNMNEIGLNRLIYRWEADGGLKASAFLLIDSLSLSSHNESTFLRQLFRRLNHLFASWSFYEFVKLPLQFQASAFARCPLIAFTAGCQGRGFERS